MHQEPTHHQGSGLTDGGDGHRLKGCERLLSVVWPVRREDVDCLYPLRCNRDIATGSNENWLRVILKTEKTLAGRELALDRWKPTAWPLSML